MSRKGKRFAAAAVVVVLGTLVLGALVFALQPMLLFALWSPYLHFMGKDARYYSEVARACDSIMREHPVSSSNSVTLYGRMILPYTLRVSVNDASLPKIIKKLHPNDIFVSTNRVFIEIPPERMGGFSLSWARDELQPKHWTLESNGDGLAKTVYEETKLR